MNVTGASEIAMRLAKQEVRAADVGFAAVLESVVRVSSDLGRGGIAPPFTPFPIGADTLTGFRTQAVSALEHLEHLSVINGLAPAPTLVKASDDAIAAARRGVSLIDSVSPNSVDSADLDPIVSEFTNAQKQTGQWLSEA